MSAVHVKLIRLCNVNRIVHHIVSCGKTLRVSLIRMSLYYLRWPKRPIIPVSVAALQPLRDELINLQASLMSQLMRKVIKQYSF